MKNTISLLTLCLFFTINYANAQDSLAVKITTKDSINISATYHLPKIKKAKIPAIILIHQGGSSREEWYGLSIIDKLLTQGYAVFAYDVRLHGDSDKDEGSLSDLFNNPNRAPNDLQAVIKFLQNDSRIDKNRIGIIGASIGGNLACMASENENIKSVVVLSAKTSAAQNLSGKTDPIVPKNAFYIASEEEQKGMRKKWAEELYKITLGEKRIEITKGNKHGSYILRDFKDTEDHIIDWILKTL
ncbi:alpha/beta fold hydrolase [Aureibaculum conchae]|uniref:alpha/beta fold hydrolase n=1 Tax=Aureibaculum sp. 2308TA14-22 TaxID=3108392 RepID=UPI0033924B6D